MTAILIGAGSRGAKAYAPYALLHPDRIKFVAVAEPIEQRRTDFCNQHGISPEMAFRDHTELFQQNVEADVVFVCTQDTQHREHALQALEKGYHLVLEKPISTSLQACEEIVAGAQEKNRALIICHVLRYTGFFQAIKESIRSGEIGEVLSITLNENVGYAHAAHSYVRGNWRNEAISSPMLLAKSCHDMDILCWLMESPCTKVSSFGGLHFFKKENAPAGCASRCLDGCKAKAECPFDAEKIYMDPAITGWPVNVITEDISASGRQKALLEGPYGRCVFHCDNDVVDHQVVNLEFENGRTANFAMNSLSAETCRVITVYGTKGELTGKMEDNRLLKQIYGAEPEVVAIPQPEAGEYGHGGGDVGLMDHVWQLLESLEPDRSIPPCDAIYSHRICFAAETARKNNTVERLSR